MCGCALPLRIVDPGSIHGIGEREVASTKVGEVAGGLLGQSGEVLDVVADPDEHIDPRGAGLTVNDTFEPGVLVAIAGAVTEDAVVANVLAVKIVFGCSALGLPSVRDEDHSSMQFIEYGVDECRCAGKCGRSAFFDPGFPGRSAEHACYLLLVFGVVENGLIHIEDDAPTPRWKT